MATKGRHRRPSKAAKAAPVIGGSIAAGGMALAVHSSPAYAASFHPVTPVSVGASSRESVTVASGDTLSGLAQQYCGNPGDWSGLYAANRAVIGADPQLIIPGQVLVITCSAVHAPPVLDSETTVDPSDYSGFQACVIERESGGNSQVMNSTGHYGLYQFSYSTWVGYGGAPSEFGDATVAEQNAVFATAMADGGEDNWSPYDGCIL